MPSLAKGPGALIIALAKKAKGDDGPKSSSRADLSKAIEEMFSAEGTEAKTQAFLNAMDLAEGVDRD